ncbi:MAG TPA: hypothetical protein VHZ09_05650 [Acidobacteriaceae bacterium]|jgi:hypothetical protein|nr:hypothetical protein [Acidobacteriaceae bacterium]
MNVTTLAGVLWAAGFMEHAALFLLLLVLARWKRFLFFTSYMGFNVVRTITLFCAFRFAPSLYAPIYWSAAGIEFALQILVILEVMRAIVPPGLWGEDARRRFRVLSSAGVVVAFGLTVAIHNKIPHSYSEWIDWSQIFSTTLAVVLLLAMSLSTTALGLVWSRHVAALGTGLAVWGLVDFFVEGAYQYFGPRWHGVYLDYFRILAYQAVVLYWIASFSRRENSRILSAGQHQVLNEIQSQAEAQADLLGRRKH